MRKSTRKPTSDRDFFAALQAHPSLGQKVQAIQEECERLGIDFEELASQALKLHCQIKRDFRRRS